eukprot:s90_g10.t1
MFAICRDAFLGDAEKSLQHFQQSMTLRNKLGLKRTVGGGELCRNVGLAQTHRADLGEATKAFDEAIDICYDTWPTYMKHHHNFLP